MIQLLPSSTTTNRIVSFSRDPSETPGATFKGIFFHGNNQVACTFLGGRLHECARGDAGQVIDQQHIKLRVYERGVGETSACGSGAAAAVIAGRLWDLLDARVTVIQPGGNAIVSWADSKAAVCLTGPAVTVFNGIINI